MDDPVIFCDYTLGALDAQYNNRARVPGHVAYHERWSQESAEARHRLRCHRDVSYGPGGAQTLDVFVPDGDGAAPVQVFFHGGYWFSRDKDDFSFLAPAVVASGAVQVIVDYPLIPSVDMDELVHQCRAALAWVHGNIAEYGGDPERLFICGHSAGGHIVTMMMTTDWPSFADAPSRLIKGGCALSGIYDLEPIRLCFINQTLGLTAEQVARNSSINLLPPPDAPLILAVGGNESDEFRRQTAEMAEAWGRTMDGCTMIERPGLDHFTILGDLADSQSPLMDAIRAQMEE